MLFEYFRQFYLHKEDLRNISKTRFSSLNIRGHTAIVAKI
jgi:hypothetical protein